MADNPLKLPFDFPPNTKPTTHQIQKNFEALLKFVSDLNTAVISLSNLIVGTLQTTSTATIGGTLTAQAAATVSGALTANSTAALNGAVTAASTLGVTGAVTANNGVTVNNAALVANAALTANSTAALNGAVTAGSTIAATGLVTANNGVTVNNAALTANSTSALNGAVTAGSTVAATGLVTANNGVTVNNAALTANSTSALNGAVTAGSTLGVTGDVTASSKVKIADGAVNAPSLTFTSSGAMGLYKVATNSLAITTSSTQAVNVDASGNILQPTQPSFLVSRAAALGNAQTGDVDPMSFPTEAYDIGGNFTSNVFTAPVTGKYFFAYSVNIGPRAGTPATFFRVKLSTSNGIFTDFHEAPVVDESYSASIVCDMDSGDTAKVVVDVALGTTTWSSEVDALSYFTGTLIN